MSRRAGTWMCLSLALSALPAAGGEESPATRPAGADGGELLHQTRQDVQKAWHESLTPPASEAACELQKLIEELRSIRVSPGGAAGRPVESPAGPTTMPAVAAPTSMPAVPARAAAEAAATAPADESPGLPAKIIAQLQALPASSLAHPVELADELYRGGYLKAAAALYGRALKSDADADTKAWAAYQTANCLRDSDPAGAAAMYLRVISEHSSSPWAATAAAERNLLTWMQSENPRALLEGIAPIGRGPTTQPAARPTTYPAAGSPAAGAGKATHG